MTLAALVAALHVFQQPVMNYCPQHAGWYPPSHWPCR